jgi:glycosyltransferase involved in cell wall biosynthesis
MKKALVIHPVLSIYTGGELLCLQVCQALLRARYDVTLYSDANDPAKAEEVYPGMGKVLSKCHHIPSNTEHRSVPGIAVIKDFKDIRRTESHFQEIAPDVTFCTQSSLFHVPSRLYHFIYHGTDLFQYSASYLSSSFPKQKLPHGYITVKRGLNDFLRKILQVKPPNPDWYFALSPSILARLRNSGRKNSSLIFQPSTQFQPRQKKEQVIQVTRLIPEKRVEIFLEAARRLPEYRFLLLARTKPGLEAYARDIEKRIPANVIYLKTTLGQAPHLLEESKVYLYTGAENAMMLSVVAAISAGCYPIVAKNTGPEETIEALGVGTTFSSIADLVPTLRRTMQEPTNPPQISEKAKPFSTETFEQKIVDIADNGVRPETGGN